MGITKSELLSADSSNAAVSLALAETHVIAETKKYFEEAGIVLDSLSPRVPRSQTTILVKNIPYGTTMNTLTDLFNPHGKLARILLPPAGTLGVVEFENNMDAGRAFKALSYRRLGNAVLYLEKGPVGMFQRPPVTNGVQRSDAKLLANRVASAAKEALEANDEAGSTLFLKNLSFATTTERLSTVLAALPDFCFARVQTKPDPKRPGERLSLGYGFVGFKTRESANKAMGGLEGFEVDGKALEVKFAQRGVEEKEGKGIHEMKGKTKSTKVLVKNLPFEASKKDVRELFRFVSFFASWGHDKLMWETSAYGTLKSLRLPKKSSLASSGAQSTRGFAFLEFTTHTEAARAMDALRHTHLLGRHLVMEWAKEGESVDVSSLREKVGRDFKDIEGEGDRVGKKRKLNLIGPQNGEEMDGLEV